MHSIEPATAPRPGSEPRLVTLGSREIALPPRVRSLLEGVLALAGNIIERSFGDSLNEYEQQLFKQAEKARSSNEQHAVFESLREVKRGRADAAPRFLLFLESALARLDSRPAAAAPAPRFQELTLLDTRDQEENLALQEIATKAEIRHSQALYALGHRFGVMAGTPALDAESLPLGPQQLCAALRYSTACLGLVLEHRLLLYRQFDRRAMAEIGSLYTAVNDYLVQQRILPNLQLSQRYGASTPAPASAAKPAAGAEATATPPATPAPTPTAPVAASAPALARAPMPHEDARDSELFHTLRELLSGRRQAVGQAPPPRDSISDYVATGEDIQSVLGSLQHRPAAPMMLGGRVVQRTIGHLKQDLVQQLRQFTPDGKPPQLTDVDADTLDLVGMLFDFIAKDMRASGSTQSLLTKLQVPVLRVALRDKSFFTRRSHPARQLLNAIAETGQYWIDESEGDADRLLVEKMQLVVDRVSNEFDGRDELFDELLTDLSRHMGTLARKAEVAERRHVDAAKGRERLDMARERASQAVAERLQDKKINRLVRTLLEQAWTDVLALTILRQGEESDAYRRRIAVADQLIAGSASADDTALRTEIEQGLSQVGFHADDAHGMVQQLFSSSEQARDDSAATRTELALKLKSKARLGEETGSAPAAAAAPAATPAAKTAAETPTPLNAEERQTLERLKTLPFGTWFEFVINQQGDTVRRKLSWFSTLTGRCLFVNQRGARTEERTLHQLSRDLVRKQVRIVTVEKESMIDRAWDTIVTTLKQFTGLAPAPQPAH